MKKVLIVANLAHASPRIPGLAKYFNVYGWKPIIISADESVNYDKDYSLLKEIPKDTNVFRVGHKQKSKIWQYATKKLKLDYSFPDTLSFNMWFLPAYRLAKEIILRVPIINV